MKSAHKAEKAKAFPVFFCCPVRYFTYIKIQEERRKNSMQFDVKIRKVIENGKPLKALASVTVDGSFTIHNVRVIKTENAKFVAMPYATYQDAEGKDVRRDIVHPIKSEVRKALETAVFAAYEQKISEKAE